MYEIENASMIDAIPAELDFVDGSVQVDGKTAVYSYDNANGTLTVPLDNIAPAAEKVVTFSVVVNESAYGKTVYNSAVMSGDNIPDTEGTDDGVSVGDGKARPSIEKTADKSSAKVGDKNLYADPFQQRDRNCTRRECGRFRRYPCWPDIRVRVGHGGRQHDK